MNKTDFDELSKEIEDSLGPEIGEKNIRILVFGPDLENKDKASAKLRKYIVKKCQETGYVVVLAEHEEIRQLYERFFHSANDLCKMEYHLAKAKSKSKGTDIIDGIIIIPDSAGSFIELGMFVIEDSLHEKVLVLFNKKYKLQMATNFVGLGAKAAFDNGNAKTKLINYNSRKDAFNEVSKFLNFRQGEKHWKIWRRQGEPSL